MRIQDLVLMASEGSQKEGVHIVIGGLGICLVEGDDLGEIVR